MHNTMVPQIKDIMLVQEENITSYDVAALFTSVLVAPALKVVQNKIRTGSGYTVKD